MQSLIAALCISLKMETNQMSNKWMAKWNALQTHNRIVFINKKEWTLATRYNGDESQNNYERHQAKQK